MKPGVSWIPSGARNSWLRHALSHDGLLKNIFEAKMIAKKQQHEGKD